jgi:hypothetical protein
LSREISKPTAHVAWGATDDERHQTGERFGIRVVTGPADGPAGAQP